MGNSKNIQRIAFFDDKGKTIAECNIYQVDFSKSQTLEAHVPVGYEIIGLQANTEQLFIHTLGFIVWKPNKMAQAESYKPIKQDTIGKKSPSKSG